MSVPWPRFQLEQNEERRAEKAGGRNAVKDKRIIREPSNAGFRRKRQQFIYPLTYPLTYLT
jgi:hypothetical protein